MTEFLSAKALDIEEQLHGELIWVLEQLEAKRLEPAQYEEEQYKPMGFDMSVGMDGPGTIHENVYKCGTAGCIAGWCAIKRTNIQPTVDGYRISREVVYTADDILETENKPLKRLFMGYAQSDRDRCYFTQLHLEKITPDSAAKALRNYLTTGEPNWESVYSLEEGMWDL